MTCRYALYFAPAPQTQLEQFGRKILSRTANTARQTDATTTFADPTRWLALTKSAAHYGFHATLKAPFELQADQPAHALMSAVSQFASQQHTIVLETLAPRRMDNYLALTLEDQPMSLNDFSQHIVESFEPFRQPLSEADIQRRLEQPLTSRQQCLLHEFGYPHVADQFHFHMTLAGNLSEHDDDFCQWAGSVYSEHVTSSPVIDRICVFRQLDRQTPFVQIANFPFEG